MKIGILKETKTPIDNRVALTPQQIAMLQEEFPEVSFKVQSSDIRAYSDAEYIQLGVAVSKNVDDCDLLLGIKEADISTLIQDKHYLFFGHIAKKQPYNKNLFKTLIDRRITFSDYEYIVDDEGNRLVAFGWYAGVVGIYYTLMGWGIKTNRFTLPKPHLKFTIQELIENLRKANIDDIKIVLTGNGRVSHGVQYILDQIGAKRVSVDDFITNSNADGIECCVAEVEDLVKENSGKSFDMKDFIEHPENYVSNFWRFAESADILVCCHFWNNDQPVFLTEEDLKNPDMRIKMIGDITCDIQGSVKSTLRSTTHGDEFYDYNPITGQEEKAFSRESNVAVMAVDTCPNALPRETSKYFGEKLIEHVLKDLLANRTDRSKIFDRATILRNGVLTKDFEYLSDYVSGF